MDAKTRQQQLDDISPEDLAKIKAHQASTEGSFKVDNEWLLMTEFAIVFGWHADLDVKEDKIETAEMLTLIEASRKLKARDMFHDAQSALIGAGSAAAKKPSQAFNTLTKDLIKQMKVDE